jgi:pimeloyl-ACP methyl ester carboxylesterase
MKVVFEDEQMSFQTLRLLSEIPSGLADVNEVIGTARKITEGSYESWCDEWTKTADRVREQAEQFLEGGHRLSAAETYLRACNYYRTAGFYRGLLIADGCGAEVRENLEKLDRLSLKCFSKVIQYGKTKIEPIEVPYENTTLPGHFYRLPSETDFKAAPTLVMINGYDGTKEEMYGCALEALKRGMNCFAFEGPGQGEMIRTRGIPFRPDWENVVTPVLDYLIGELGVAPDRIVLWGESMGGYLAPRAVAFDHRAAACVANSGVYDFMGTRGPKGIDRNTYFGMIEQMPAADFEAIIKKQMDLVVQLSWALKHGMYVFQAKNLKDYFLKAKDYYMGDAAAQIACPTLVIDTEGENNFPGQAKTLYDALKCPKDYLLFTEEEGAEEHCEEGAKLYANCRIFDWIEDTLRRIGK